MAYDYPAPYQAPRQFGPAPYGRGPGQPVYASEPTPYINNAVPRQYGPTHGYARPAQRAPPLAYSSPPQQYDYPGRQLPPPHRGQYPIGAEYSQGPRVPLDPRQYHGNQPHRLDYQQPLSAPSDQRMRRDPRDGYARPMPYNQDPSQQWSRDNRLQPPQQSAPPMDRSRSADLIDSGRPPPQQPMDRPRKPLIEAIPLTIAQDNAFPVFPGKEKGAKSMTDRIANIIIDDPVHSPPLNQDHRQDSGAFSSNPNQDSDQQRSLDMARPQNRQMPTQSYPSASPPIPHALPYATPSSGYIGRPAGPLNAYPESPDILDPAQSSHTRDGSTGNYLHNAYDDYHAPMPLDSREAQIEAEMPNFSRNAPPAPVHRYGVGVDDHLNGPSGVGPPPQPDFYQYGTQSQPLTPAPPRHGTPQSLARAQGSSMPPRVSPMPSPALSQQRPPGPRGDPRFMAPSPTLGSGSPRVLVPPYGGQRPGSSASNPASNSLSEDLYRTQSAPAQATPGSTNPDALPSHPAPVRPGLAQQSRLKSDPSTSSLSSIDRKRLSQPQPVTRAELDRLQSQVNAYPQDSKLAYNLAMKLAEAATVLASEGGRLDTKATEKNREMYNLDAHRRLKRLANNNYADAMFYLANCYSKGSLGLSVDPKEAFGLYQSAGKLGHAEGSYRTALCCELGPEGQGGTRLDHEKAVLWYRRAAQLRSQAGMYKLGVLLLNGSLGERKSIREAETWLKCAAERPDAPSPHALHQLGLLYDPDTTDREIRAQIAPDKDRARIMFQQAANLGLKSSQARLGLAYEYGSLGLPIDARSSIAWYSKSAAQGDHTAELALSGWYLTGSEKILERSDQEAYLWARKAAVSEPPLAKAMFAMGYYTERGIGCPTSVEEAKKWYGRAAFYKFPKAIERLEELKGGSGSTKAKSLDPRRIEGDRLARKDQKKDDAECVIM